MMPLVPLFLLLALVVIAAGAGRQLVLASRGGVAAAPEEKIVNALRWGSLVLGLLVAWVVAGADDSLGRNLVVAPVAFGLCLLAGSALAELLVRSRYLPGPRQAELTPRTVRDHLPAVLTPVLAATAALGLTVCTWAVLIASSDDMGRAGRSFDHVCGPGHTGSRGPFPGSFYVTPYAVGVAVALVLAVGTALVVARRPLGGTPAQAQRHRDVGVGAVVAALGVVVAAPLAGIAFFAATTVLGGECSTTLERTFGWGSVVLLLLSGLTLALSLGRLLVGGASTAALAADRTRVGTDA